MIVINKTSKINVVIIGFLKGIMVAIKCIKEER
jgi:hypothetical protein